MLVKLNIENYALVEKIEIDFGPGLTVITGETGAGKSVIVGGLILALGDRADRDMVRHGSEKTLVETIFSLDKSSSRKRLSAILPQPPGDNISFRREVTATGNSRGFIDDHSENLTVIREAASVLCDLHTQQGQRSLLETGSHLALLDGFAGLVSKTEKLRELFGRFTALERELQDATANARRWQEKLELINFQVQELSAARIESGEEERLEGQRKILASTRMLAETGQNIVAAVSEGENAILSSLSQLDKALRQAATIDPALHNEAETMAGAIIGLNELSRNLESYCSRLEDDPERLEMIDARLAELHRLKKKYRADEAGLLALLVDLQSQSHGSADVETLLKELAARLAAAKSEYLALALAISAKRRQSGTGLARKIERELTELAMPDAKLEIRFSTEGDEQGFPLGGEIVRAFPHGLENAEFFISTNKNEPLRPLAKIASGGELSRIMLAILSIIAGQYDLPTIVFDEIDSGIGGQTAIRLAEKLKTLSQKYQIIAISHLPAIARRADHHLAVSKTRKNGRNIITVKALKADEADGELARMTAVE